MAAEKAVRAVQFGVILGVLLSVVVVFSVL